MRPERHVKLTKQDKNKLKKKLKKGWKSKIVLPDYTVTEDGSLAVKSDKLRRAIKMVRILDDSIFIEKAINKKKNIKIAWSRISLIQPSRDLKDALEVTIADGSIIEFEVYSSFKVDQIKGYIIEYVNQKRLESNSNLPMHN
jgi:hypothetical protein